MNKQFTTRQAYAHLTAMIDKVLSNVELTKEQQLEQSTKMVIACLDSLRQEGGYQNFNVGTTEIVNHTWKTLYPEVGKRIAAFLFFKLVGKSRYDRQRWFHTVFPFKVTYETTTFRHFYEEKFVPEAETLEANIELAISSYDDSCGKPRYSAELLVPFQQMLVPVFITPTVPMNYINCSIHIQPTNDHE
jgi:hypothetical protein